MKIKVNSNKSKRGFTIVELVVALAIVLTMSFAAISTIDFQNRVYRNTLQTTEATNLAENAVECFRFAGKAGFAGAYQISLKDDNGKTIMMSETTGDDNGTATYTFQKNGMDVKIVVTENTLIFTATTIDTKDVVLEESYTK